MKKLVLLLWGCLILIPAVLTAANSTATKWEKFYGRIVTIDPASQKIVASNKKQQIEDSFQWDDKTKVSYKQNPIQAAELKPGQYVVISFAVESNENKAKKIVLRDPPNFQKKQTQQ